jgi:putative FmdB family regulatory protein
MPTYQYACTNPECGDQFELVQSFTDPAASTCPVCGQPVRKRYGSVGVVFKGPGFYRTDSRATASSASESKSDAKSNAKSDGKSESKSDGKRAADKKSEPAGSGAGGSTKAAASA